MDDRNLQNPNDLQESKEKAKKIWKNVGLIGVALALAVVTVFVLSLNR